MATLELLNKVAEGSAAEAFLARTETETVLVELSRPGLAADTELYGRFLDEARERQKLTHPHLVQLRASGCRPDGRLFAVSESLSGLHLGSLGAVAADQAIKFLVPLCEALSYLHQRGVVHGHLRPSHVFLSGTVDAPIPKLLDMGLLLFRSTKSLKTPTKVVLVPAEYLSPERICGQRASPRSDVYGLGVLAFELLTGRPPFRGANDEETRRQHMTAKVPQLPESALWLQPWVNRCLQKDLEGRFASVDEARDALLEAQVARAPSAVAGQTVSMRGGDEPPVVTGKLEAEAQQLGPYRLLSLLGEGGMGQVWLAEHQKLERKVAIKLLKPDLVRVESQVQRFIDEARAVNRVNHPHIVEITDFVEERELGRVWCVMEYLKGSTLKGLARERAITISSSVKIVRQVCEALQAAHQVGVVHRDIKPDNVFLVEGRGPEHFVKVLDFGVAKLRQERSGGHTDTGEIVGTPAYMSPEQALGQEVGPPSDLYSVGTLLYVLLAGRFPFDGVTAGQVVANIVAREPLPLPKVSRSGEVIPAALDRVVMRCLQKEPSQRFGSMLVLAQALGAFEGTAEVPIAVDELDVIEIDEASHALVAPAAAGGLRPRSRGRVTAAVLGIGVAVAGAAFGAHALWSRKAPALGPQGSAPSAAEVRAIDVAAGPVEVAPAPASPSSVAAPVSAPPVQVAPGPSEAPGPAAAPAAAPLPPPAKKSTKKRRR